MEDAMYNEPNSSPKGKKAHSAIIGAIVIIVILILAAVYLFKDRDYEEPYSENLAEESGDNTAAEDPPLSDSNTLDDIESDLDSSSFDDLDLDFDLDELEF